MTHVAGIKYLLNFCLILYANLFEFVLKNWIVCSNEGLSQTLLSTDTAYIYD